MQLITLTMKLAIIRAVYAPCEAWRLSQRVSWKYELPHPRETEQEYLVKY